MDIKLAVRFLWNYFYNKWFFAVLSIAIAIIFLFIAHYQGWLNDLYGNKGKEGASEFVATILIGIQLSMNGKGNAGERNGPAGDLIVQIEETPHEELQRDGNDVLYNLYISFPEAVMGTNAEVPTIDGKARIKVEPGTQSGKVLKLKGKGLPDINSRYHVGDQLVYVNVWTPKQLNSEEKALLEKLKNSENFKPNPGKKEKGFFSRMFSGE